MSRHPHWNPQLHPRIPGKHKHGGEFTSKHGGDWAAQAAHAIEASGPAPKAQPGVTRVRPGTLKSGDYVLDVNGKPRRVESVYLRPVGHFAHPGTSKVSLYVIYGKGGHDDIIRTRHGGGVTPTSLVDKVPADWAAKVEERTPTRGGRQNSTTEIVKVRPGQIRPGDMVLDSEGNATLVDRVVLHKPGESKYTTKKVSTYTFYDRGGNPIPTRHGKAHTGTSQVEVVRPQTARGLAEPPDVQVGDPTDWVTRSRLAGADQARHRLAQWGEDMAKPGRRRVAQTRREVEIQHYERRLQSELAAMERAKVNVRKNIQRKWYRSDAEYEAAIEQTLWDGYNNLDHTRGILAKLRNPSFTSVAGMSRLDEPYQDTAVLAQEINPERPLAVYGDMLNIADGTWHTYQALDALEQRVPAVLHQAVAAHMAQFPKAGIFVGTRPVPDLDDLGHLRDKQPRGWYKGATWMEVDGVHTPEQVIGIGYTSNTESHMRARKHWHTERGSPLHGKPVEGSAALHEFGHGLDDALGGPMGRASADPEYRKIHARVVKEAGSALNPYFRQKSEWDPKDPSPGAQEFFAEAFSIWARYDATPKLDMWGNEQPIYGATNPMKHLPGGPLTWQEYALSQQFHITKETARKLSKHYHGLVAQVAGKG